MERLRPKDDPVAFSLNELPWGEIGRHNGVILEVNAGHTPVSIALARRQSKAFCIAQDIGTIRGVVRKKVKEAPCPNFKFFVGETGALMQRLGEQNIPLVALLSILPYLNTSTLEWLPDVISTAVKTNPQIYIGIMTERMTGKPGVGAHYNLAESLTACLIERGIQLENPSIITFEQARSLVGPTEYMKETQKWAQDVYLLEHNPQRRGELLSAI